MKLQFIRRFVTVAILAALLLLSGCAEVRQHSFTYKLWHMEELRHFREPSQNPQVHVHYAPSRKDYLVSYNSLRDGEDKPRRLAYFLGDYESRKLRDPDARKPHLVSTDNLGLLLVPECPSNLPCATFDTRLTIHTTNGMVGPYSLPTYLESNGTVVKSALTPFTALGDATCVSLFVGIIAAYAVAHGHYTTQ